MPPEQFFPFFVMTLSAFPVASFYSGFPLTRRFSEEFSRPGLTNFLGSLQVDADPTGIRHLIMPPVSGGDEATCYLTINGVFIPASGAKVSIHWTPEAVERRCRIKGWEVRARLVMPFGAPGCVQTITVTNTSPRARRLDLAVRISGRCLNQGKSVWAWGVPTVSTSVYELLLYKGLDPFVEDLGGEGRVFQEKPVEGEPDRGHACNAQLLSPKPDRWLGNGDAAYSREVGAGESATWYFAMAMAPERAAAADAARALLREAPKAAEQTAAAWRRIWADVFSGGDTSFGGSLRDLHLSEELAPVAASAVFNLLVCRRSGMPVSPDTHYITVTPRRCEAGFFTWDWGLACTVLARLEPASVRLQIEIVLKSDWRNNNQYNLLERTGRGWTYSANAFSLFLAVWHYWKARGGSLEALAERFETRDGERTLGEVMEMLAFDWRRLRKDPSVALGDYGPKADLLECVATYAHRVAALNAGAAWMLRRFAEICELRAPGSGAAYREEATAIREAIVEHLYVKGGGYFRCLYPDGRGIECRHAYDVGMVLWCLGAELPRKVAREIVRFIRTELMTLSWCRALSPHDGDAAVSGLRADHQFSGAYTAWPALLLLGLLEVRETRLAGRWLRGLARTARQGPFGQGHWDEAVVDRVHGGAAKVSDELPQACHWCDISGAIFYHVMERYAELVPSTKEENRAGLVQ